MLTACCVPLCPWTSTGGLCPDSCLQPGSWPPAPVGFGAPVLQWEETDDWQVPVWDLLSWQIYGQRRLLVEKRMGMTENISCVLSRARWPGACGIPQGHTGPRGSCILRASFWLLALSVRTRMLPECCRTLASDVLCGLMDKININLHFFFLFSFLFNI